MNSNEILDSLENYMTTDIFIKKYNKRENLNQNISARTSIHKIKIYNDECVKNNKFNNTVCQNTIKQHHKKNKMLDNNDNKSIEQNKNDFTPDEKDKLFWCFYIFIHGYEKYELEKTSSFKIEKEFKFMIAEKLDSLKNDLKELGLKKNDIREELTNDNCISIKSLLVLCYIYKINVLYVKNNYYYLIESTKENKEEIINPLNCIINDNNKIYIKHIDNNKEEQDKILLYYKDNYLRIENINKPIKSFSSYSLSELQNICKKLKLPIEDNNKKLLKKQLYESIIKVF